MKKIVSFEKEIPFKTDVSEITSISLEHSLKTNDFDVNGVFTISGTYKMADTSSEVENFSFDIPFSIKIDDKYDTKDISIDIDDFYYEVVNNKILSVNIDVCIDNLEEKVELVEHVKRIETLNDDEYLDEVRMNTNIIKEEVKEEKERCVEEEDIEPKQEKVLNSLFDNLDDGLETYKSYHVYIVREGDTLENILNKYNITKEELEDYNDLKELRINDKIIIPTTYAES